MDFSIAAFLVQDGLISGAVYALLGVAIVLVFSVTRVIFVPQGEFVAFGALSMAALQAGHAPGTMGLLVVLAALVLVVELWRMQRGLQVDWRMTILWAVILPLAAAAMVWG